MDSVPLKRSALSIGTRFRVLAGGASELRNLCLFEAAFYVGYKYAMSFTQQMAAPFWFPDALLLSALLLTPPRRWWVYLLAPLPIRLLVGVAPGMPAWFLVAAWLNDSLKALFGALALRYFLKKPIRFDTVRELLIYVLFALTLLPMLSAFGGAWSRHALGFAFWPAWRQWLLGDALANLVLTPAILYWAVGGYEAVRAASWQRRLEGIVAGAGLVDTGLLAFGPLLNPGYDLPARLYLPVPFLAWIAIRFGLRGASAGLSLISALAIVGALQGKGPFSSLHPELIVLSIQLFLLVAGVPTLLLAALSAERSRAILSLREASEDLRESEARFRIVADAAPALIWMSGPDKLCTFFNQPWLNFTGRKLEQELGNGWTEGLHPEDMRQILSDYREHFDARKPFALNYRMRRGDGGYRFVVNHGVPRYDVQGNFAGYIGSCVDLTERKQAELELQRQRAELAHVARLTTMGELTASLAHELSHPQTAILSNAQAGELFLAAQPPAVEEVRKILADIVRDNRRAVEIIQRLRSFLRKRELDFEQIDINQLIREIVSLVQPDAGMRHVGLRLELTQGLPAVRADRVHLQQVLLNVMLNGMDAMNERPQRNRELLIETRLARVGGEAIEVAVRDSGLGISADKINSLFEPFFTTKAHGMGMGLSISRNIIEAHGGSIKAENNPDAGATIRFTIPVAFGSFQIPQP